METFVLVFPSLGHLGSPLETPFHLYSIPALSTVFLCYLDERSVCVLTMCVTALARTERYTYY